MDNLFMIRRADEELDAEEISVRALCDLIGMAPPLHWPPLTFGAAERGLTRAKLKEDADNVEWIANYVAVQLDGTNYLVGCAGLTGKPGPDRSVELRFAMALEHQLQGYGTAAVALILRYAFMMSPDVDRVTARVEAGNGAAVRVLEKNGLTLQGTSATGAQLYAIDRERFETMRAQRPR